MNNVYSGKTLFSIGRVFSQIQEGKLKGGTIGKNMANHRKRNTQSKLQPEGELE